MRVLTARVSIVLLALLAGACSLLLNFQPEGQPCDGAGQCLAGYTCVSGACHGADAGVDACGGCATGMRCALGATPTCVNDVCATRVCPVGFACAEGASGSTCDPIAAPALGHACSTDAQCQGENSTHVCFLGAIQTTTGGGTPRTGVCMERCAAGACATTGATCTTIQVGLDAGTVKLCLVPGLVTRCTSDAPCVASGLVCTEFDHPAVGPVTLCDRPLEGGAAVGATCKVSSPQSQASDLCANGLCVPRSTGTCGTPCTATSCPSGELCSLVEFSNPGPVRLVPMCVPAKTRCLDCTANAAVCGADAPHCTPMGSGSECLLACGSDAGTQAVCPSGYSCQVLGSGPRCVPTVSTTCP